MKRYPLRPSSLAVCALLALAACGKTAGVPQAKRVNTESTSRVESLASKGCARPFELEDPTRNPIMRLEDFPKAKFKLIELQMHHAFDAEGSSFSALSREADQFQVKVECNSIREKGDGSEASDTHLSGNFSASTGVDAIQMIRSDDVREMKLAFENGKPVIAETLLKEIPSERFSVGEDSFLTLRFYQPSATQFEVRLKWEGPKDESGFREVQHSRAVYETI
jgi:hypothetical protein